METRSELIQILHDYNERYGVADEDTKPLRTFLDTFDSSDLYRRNNFTGHITASAFVYRQAPCSLLLIHHKALQKWLQPGGHVDSTDVSIQAAALREVAEETGLATAGLTAVPGFLDIDSHPIPANPRKQEPAHVHHDIRYLFVCNSNEELVLQLEEITDLSWVPLDQLQEGMFSRIVKKINALKEEGHL